jgi:SAM-dependent methyltransferase
MTEKLEPHLAQSFGYHALLYSSLAKVICADALPIKHQVVISPDVQERHQLSLVCRYEELPIASDSVDLVVLPKILQNSCQPHEVLREAERVLIPEGQLIIIGRHPYRWRGLKKRFKSLGSKQQPSADISQRRIIDWLRLLGLEVDKQVQLCCSHKKLQQSQLSPKLKKLASYLCHYVASYYVIIAQKKVSSLTPIRPSWRRNKQLVPPRLAEPSVKGQVENWFEQLK